VGLRNDPQILKNVQKEHDSGTTFVFPEQLRDSTKRRSVVP